ncbi:hypothetical protein HDU87_005018 [Geranomyces variabilis]|uniref:Uncharacterized protein n=1 Tax=Geranomyces variabilis TaxID=109894 RepID=A0AAD5TSL4_9FUNG|nr:hypothetical protein HDU87_005018 [Geranomyces variabilis]
MSFFQRLFARSADVAAAGAAQRILPSPSFYKAVARGNEVWAEHCIKKPVFCRGQKIHLLGVSPVNLPTGTHVSSTIPKLHEPLGWLCVDEAEEDAEWLNRYAQVLRQCPVGEPTANDGSDVEVFLAGVRTWSERVRHQLLDEGTPEIWVEALASTGLRPAWDTIEAIELSLAQRVPVEFIKMGPAEENQRLEMRLAQTKAKAETMQAENYAEPPSPQPLPSSSTLEDGLRSLFHFVGISSDDLRAIRTSDLPPFVETNLRNLVLGPAELARYGELVSAHLAAAASAPSASRDAKERWRVAEARNFVRCERLVERLQDITEEFEATNGPDKAILAIIDRSSIHGVRKMIEELE